MFLSDLEARTRGDSKVPMLNVLLAIGLLVDASPAQPSAEQPVAGENRQPSADDARARAIEALQTLDGRRLETDRAYAEAMIGHLQAIGALPDAEARIELDNLRMAAFVTLERTEEARAAIDRVLSSRSAMAEHYYLPWLSSLRIGDQARAVEAIVQASRNLRASEWPMLREMLPEIVIWRFMHELHRDGRGADRIRLAEALYRVGWPNYHDVRSIDSLRSILIDDRIARGETAEAAQLISALSSAGDLLPMLVLTKYDEALANGDRIALLREVIARQDRQSAESLGAFPNDLRRTLDRIEFLRLVGRNLDVLAAAEPFLADVPATVAADPQGMWLINETVQALQALDRHEEAVALMSRLAALPVAGNTELVGPIINHSSVLLEAGRAAEALEHVLGVERDMSQYSNDYGKLVIAGTIVCALVELDRRQEAAPWLDRLRAQVDVNPDALMRAHLCLDDLDAAEALVVRRLGEESPDRVVLALQDYELQSDAEGSDTHSVRYRSLRERPAVRAALDRVGRILRLPLAGY